METSESCMQYTCRPCLDCYIHPCCSPCTSLLAQSLDTMTDMLLYLLCIQAASSDDS